MDAGMKKVKLLCLPHAGASSMLFLQCEKYFDSSEIIPIDPPGRGRRMSEPLCHTIGEMIADLKRQVVAEIGPNDEYTFYGHSMGALLIYEYY
jgi:surfactin synthase thioesterase subunit